MIDTHIHLNFEEYIDDLERCISEAVSSGIDKMIVIGIDKTSSEYAINLAEQYPNLYASVGVHPSEFSESTSFIKNLLDHPKVVAIGECGLDFYYDSDNKERQIEIFREQIELSIKFKKPIIIHSRAAVRECIDIIKSYNENINGVFHCFGGNISQANEITNMGMFIGINGPVTFKNAINAKKIAKDVDIKFILTETDGPYLSPEPYRGRRNVPKNIKYIIKSISEIKKMSINEVDKVTTNNAFKLFNLEEEKWRE